VTDEMRAQLSDMRELRYCMRGCRAFFIRHGIDWDRVRREGVALGELRETGDAMALRLVEHVEAKADGRQQ